jgi:hypothetical protein
MIADLYAVGHEYVLAEAAVPTDAGARHDVTEMPYLGVGSDVGACVDDRRLVSEECRHENACACLGDRSIAADGLNAQYTANHV